MDGSQLHASALVWDNHGCLPMAPSDNLEWLPKIEKYKTAGCNIASLNIGYGKMSLDEHLVLARQMRDWIEAHSDQYLMVETASDIELTMCSDRLGLIFDVEGAGIIDDLSSVEVLYELGVRWMALAYNANNKSAGGCHDLDPGLTSFGAELIHEMERVGMIVCCSHVGYKTAEDVLKRATKPVIFSHSNPRAICDHPRNIPNELIIGCAETGGVIGVNGLKLFLGDQANVARVCDHIEHLLNLVGSKHVGLGLDYCFDLASINAEIVSMGDTFPNGLGYENPVECFEIDEIPMITNELLSRAHTVDQVTALLGGNWKRVATECWQA